MKKETQPIFKANSFYYYANEYRKHLTTEDEIEEIDMTELFYKELDQMLIRGEIIIINITSKPRLGKSTEGIALGKHIHKRGQQFGRISKKETYGLQNIARDQQEYSKIMRNEKVENTVLVIDEFNNMEDRGENITAERSFFKTVSDVQAARYIHRIYCSPKEVPDPNADIMLQLISTNHELKLSRNKLYYRYHEGGIEDTRLLGYVNIYVGDLIEKWEKIKPTYYKPESEKTEADRKKISTTMKTDFYTHYVIKKHEKIDICVKEGIYKMGLLDFAAPILQTINELQPLTKLCRRIDRETVKGILKSHIQEAKLLTSIFGDFNETDECLSILNPMIQLHKTEKEQEAARHKFQTGKYTHEQYKTLDKTHEEIKTALKKSIATLTGHLEKCRQINEQYRQTWT